MIPLMMSNDTSHMDSIAITKYGHTSCALVKQAAKRMFERISFIENRDNIVFTNTVILCGSGKNGSDGYALAKLLHENGKKCNIVQVFPPKACESIELIDSFTDDEKDSIHQSEKAETLIESADLIIDCIFGTGYDPSRGSARDEFIHICRTVKQKKQKDPKAFILSADIPSAVSADTGETSFDENGERICIQSDAVCTFMHSKPGLEVTPGILLSGEVFTEKIEELTEAEKECCYTRFVTDDTVFSLLPKRKIDSNKGTYGQLLCLCGSPDMPGAAMLSVSAALRMGTGLVRVCGIKDTLDILKCRISEPVFTTLPDINGKYADNAFNIIKSNMGKISAVLAGCGTGMDESALSLFTEICEKSSCPIVIDADMLNLLSNNKDLLKTIGNRSVITPHPGEAARLLGTDIKTINEKRIYYAQALSEKYGCVTLLKGFRTVIASPDGRIAVNPNGNNGMSKGGSGDVLAGIIASLTAQGVTLFDSAVLGAYIHGKAGDIAKDRYGERSMLPSDMVSSLPDILKDHH
ncbi:MAG: NAD(P)H-hydrate dehydratase [Ruminococcaceae bacterium]|nr:NAD(P)H-hydrate dehydratase [Oscillospiraceae bacterium]